MILGNSHKVEALAAALVNGQPEKFQMLNQPATRPGKRWQSPLEISSSSFFSLVWGKTVKVTVKRGGKLGDPSYFVHFFCWDALNDFWTPLYFLTKKWNAPQKLQVTLWNYFNTQRSLVDLSSKINATCTITTPPFFFEHYLWAQKIRSLPFLNRFLMVKNPQANALIFFWNQCLSGDPSRGFPGRCLGS